MTTRILIAGYYGFGNLGDEAILFSIVSGLKELVPEIKLSVVSADPESSLKDQNISAAVKYTDIRGLENEIADSDLVLLGGGGIFEDHNDFDIGTILTPWHSGLSYYAGIPLLSSFLQTPCVMFQVGLGPLSSSMARELTRQSIMQSSRVLVRDQASLDLAEELVREVKNVDWIRKSADSAFLIEHVRSTSKYDRLTKLGLDPDIPILGISVRHWEKAKGDWESELAAAVSAFSEQNNVQIAFLPFHRYPWIAEDDESKSRQVAKLLSEKVPYCIVSEDLDLNEILDLMSDCQLIIGMRLHSIIFSMIAGVPFMAMSYDEKVSNLMDEAMLGHLSLEPSDWKEYVLIKKMSECWHQENYPDLSGFVQSKREEAKFGLSYVTSEFQSARLVSREYPPALLTFAKKRMHQLIDSVEREAIVRNQRDMFASSKNHLEREIAAIRESFAVKILDIYWQFINRLIPEGTFMKTMYRRVMGIFHSVLPGPSMHSFDSAHPMSSEGAKLQGVGPSPKRINNGNVSPDPRVELLRFEDQVRRFNATKLVTILSTTDLIGSEGQRPTNLANELSALGVPVVFSSFRWGRSMWTAQEQINHNILHLPMDVFLRHASEVTSAFEGLERILLFEFPYTEFIPLLSRGRSKGWISVYDAIDDWDAFSNKGMVDWFDPQVEGHFVNTSDLVLAINNALKTRLQRYGRKNIALLPNATSSTIGKIGKEMSILKGELTLGYFGHLSPAWFNFQLLRDVATSKPSWIFHLIGYGDEGEAKRLPSNVILHGRQPQDLLASYAANWDVGLVPFHSGPLAEGADPIKTYEYLAMGLPVVISGVNPPENADNLVYKAETPSGFIQASRQASSDIETVQRRKKFAEANTWESRAKKLISLVDQGSQRINELRELFEVGK